MTKNDLCTRDNFSLKQKVLYITPYGAIQHTNCNQQPFWRGYIPDGAIYHDGAIYQMGLYTSVYSMQYLFRWVFDMTDQELNTVSRTSNIKTVNLPFNCECFDILNDIVCQEVSFFVSEFFTKKFWSIHGNEMFAPLLSFLYTRN